MSNEILQDEISNINDDNNKVLFQKIKNNDKKAKEELILKNLSLVTFIVNRYFSGFYKIDDDLVSLGNIALIKAVDRYDETKNVKFSSFASKCIINELKNYLIKNKKHMVNVSLNDSLGTEDETYNLEALLSDDTNLEEDYEKKEIHEYLVKLVQLLPERDKEIVKMYFGFYNRKYSQKEIADKFGIARTRVGALLARNLEILKKQVIRYKPMNDSEKTISLGSSGDGKKRIKKIYEYFIDFSKEEVNFVLENLNEKDKKLLTLKFGNDLEKPNSENWSKEDNYKFYGILVPKIRRTLETNELYRLNRNGNLKSLYEYFSDFSKEEVDFILTKLKEKDMELINLRYNGDFRNPNRGDWPKENNNKLYNILFPKMRRMLSENRLSGENSNKLPRIKTTIYQFFVGSSKEEVDFIISSLTEEEKEIIKLRYGTDLLHPTKSNLNSNQTRIFYKKIIPKMQKILISSLKEEPKQLIKK